MLKWKGMPYLVSLILLLLFYFVAYHVQRHETALLLAAYAFLFALYLWIILGNTKAQLNFWFACAILFRFVLLFSFPNLSEDVYRFIWDGRLHAAGYHPFAHTPSYYIEHNIVIPGINEALYSKLNSKDYFTIYPPVAQFLFWLCAELSSSVYVNLVLLKSFNFIAEIGTILMLKKLLRHFNLTPENVLIYALNPLIILELTANAHFEGILILFLLLGIYFMVAQRLTLSAISLAVSICVKLVPLIFLPAIGKLMGWKKTIKFYIVTFVVCAALFIPLLDMQMLGGFQNSLTYYFARFEFNASIYYLVRGLGYFFLGYNIIHLAGIALAVIAGVLILRISIKGIPPIFHNSYPATSSSPSSLDLEQLMFIRTLAGSLLIYLLFTTTLHPWYIATLLALAVFTNYRFVVLWTFMIFLTYAGYSADGFKENLWLISIEYIAVFGYFAYELWKRNSLSLAA